MTGRPPTRPTSQSSHHFQEHHAAENHVNTTWVFGEHYSPNYSMNESTNIHIQIYTSYNFISKIKLYYVHIV
jgi:hypothetical protein